MPPTGTRAKGDNKTSLTETCSEGNPFQVVSTMSGPMVLTETICRFSARWQSADYFRAILSPTPCDPGCRSKSVLSRFGVFTMESVFYALFSPEVMRRAILFYKIAIKRKHCLNIHDINSSDRAMKKLRKIITYFSCHFFEAIGLNWT
jgi:hypothetical protein